MQLFNSLNLSMLGLVLFLFLLDLPRTALAQDPREAVKQPESPLDSASLKVQRKNAIPLPSEEDSHEKHKDDDDKSKKHDSTQKRGKPGHDDDDDDDLKIQNVSFLHAFLASISVILVSEIGDKTFFIAAIMSMKHARLTVYSGAISALGLMTLLSALLGNLLTQFIPRTYTYYASSFLFAIFGLKMLRESYGMSHSDANEEYEEASSSLRESEEKIDGKSLEAGGVVAVESSDKSVLYKYVNIFRRYVSTVFLQAFVLTFLAEWGDRSQISTIILGARENIVGTVLGGTIGHAICTGAAVIGGRMIAQRISVKTVTLVGAFVFLFFAFSAFFIDPEDY